jgi:hypothetical protein
MKAKISGRADEKGFEQIRFRQLVDVTRDVDVTAGDGNCSPESKESVEVESSDFGVVTFEVGEVEMIGKCFLKTF